MSPEAGGNFRPLMVHAVEGLGEIRPGDDVARLLDGALQALTRQADGTEILVVTSKIISKSEGRYADLDVIVPGNEALRLAALTGKDPRLVELVLEESVGIVRAAPNVLITRHKLGLVMANAGIDQSNLGSDARNLVLLLPSDPDGAASQLRQRLSELLGTTPAIVISDSFGRPWRQGVVNVAIGSSGLPALIDRRGELDRDGRRLEMTQIALGDMIATAAGLVCGEGSEGIPAALISGFRLPSGDIPASALVRPAEQDLFR